MSSSHIKRLMMPRSWPLPRKTSVWVQKPDPCGHSIENCMPMGIILRDVIGVAHNRSCLLYTSPSPRDRQKSRMPSSA